MWQTKQSTCSQSGRRSDSLRFGAVTRPASPQGPATACRSLDSRLIVRSLHAAEGAYNSTRTAAYWAFTRTTPKEGWPNLQPWLFHVDGTPPVTQTVYRRAAYHIPRPAQLGRANCTLVRAIPLSLRKRPHTFAPHSRFAGSLLLVLVYRLSFTAVGGGYRSLDAFSAYLQAVDFCFECMWQAQMD